MRIRVKIYIIISLMIFFQINFVEKISSIYDPVSRPNNFFGIHILFTEELDDAVKLVNSNGGDWGYITIPISAFDKNIVKWQDFMDKAKFHHLIPILRLATEGDFINTHVWRKPTDYDIIDFANFLNSLEWPSQNRYVILFNEINRYDEWGGEAPNPEEYARIVDFSNKVFKSRNENFFLILGGFDNASINKGNEYMNEYEFLRQMRMYEPGIFNKIDGISSHSYPNPGFSQAPNNYKRVGTYTYNYEYEFINTYTDTEKPIFITETGWNNEVLSEEQIAKFYEYTFKNIWMKDNDKIVAVTPFLLKAGAGSFTAFSFLKDGMPSAYYKSIENLQKFKGEPIFNEVIQNNKFGSEILTYEKNNDHKMKFDNKKDPDDENQKAGDMIKMYFKYIFAQ